MSKFMNPDNTESYGIVVLDAQGEEAAFSSRENVSKELVLQEIENRNHWKTYVDNGFTAHLVIRAATRRLAS